MKKPSVLIFLFILSLIFSTKTNKQNFLSEKFSMKTSSFVLAGIIKIKKDEISNYKLLKCSEEERNNIYYIISSMGEKNKLWLLLHRGDLNQKGDEIRGVHPLKFLEVIFANPYLKSCMANIFQDYFKKNGFISGLSPNMSKELKKGKLQNYLKDFIKAISLHETYFESLMEFAKQEDWEGFVYFLYNH